MSMRETVDFQKKRSTLTERWTNTSFQSLTKNLMRLLKKSKPWLLRRNTKRTRRLKSTSMRSALNKLLRRKLSLKTALRQENKESLSELLRMNHTINNQRLRNHLREEPLKSKKVKKKMRMLSDLIN